MKLPWLTYPALSYLDQVDLSKLNVFEYGSGDSTTYWSSKASMFRGVEDNPKWHKKVGRPDIVSLEQERIQYVCSPLPWGLWDLIVVDGSYRTDCVKVAVKGLSSTGFIILDNSDWFEEACKYLRSNGFNQINFNGFGPRNWYRWTTSLFLKSTSVIPLKTPVKSLKLGIKQQFK